MKTNPRRNTRGGNRGQRGRGNRQNQKQGPKLARREKSNAPAGISQLVEIEFDKAAEQIIRKTRPVELKNRLRKILDAHEKGKLHTYEDYGYKNYLHAENGKVNATLGEKRPDVRVTEVSLLGEEAQPVTYTLPQHPLELVETPELEIVKEGLITAEKVNEAKEFIETDKFEKNQKLEIQLTEGITEIDSIKVRDVLQLLCTGKSLVTANNGKLTIKKFDGIKDKRPNSWLWPARFVKFVLHRNMRSPIVLDNIATKLGIQNSDKFIKTHLVNNAGYTLQFMQAEKLCPVALRDAFEKENCFISNVEFVDTPLERNSYLGLRVKISLRNVKMTEDEINAAMKYFKDTGYINYFHISVSHLRRHSVSDVGKLIVKNELIEAMEQVVYPRPIERNKWEMIRELFYASNNANIFHPLCKGIQQNPSDLQSIIFRVMIQANKGNLNSTNIDKVVNTVDVNILVEYVELFLGQIWNETLNKIIDERGGLSLDIGDLVFVDDDADSRVTQLNTYGAAVPRTAFKEDEPSYKTLVKPLTDEDIQSGSYTIYDMVLPVPGFDVAYPDNDVKEWFTKTLQSHGIDRGIEWFELVHKSAEKTCPVTFRGTYRRVALLPENLEYSTEQYLNANTPLVLSDIPRQIKAVKPVKKKEEEKAAENEAEKPATTETVVATETVKKEEQNGTTENGEKKEGENGATATATTEEKADEKKPAAKPAPEPKTALILDFFLPKGTSHIVALRELFKKNDFGKLNTPYERLVEKRETDKLCKKIKLIQREVTNQQQPPRGGGGVGANPVGFNRGGGGGGGYNEPRGRQFGNAGGGGGRNGGGNRFNRGGREPFVSPFLQAPLHDPFGRNDMGGGRGYGSGNGYNMSRGGNGVAGGGYNAPFAPAHDPAIERLEMLEREIASLRAMQSNTNQLIGGTSNNVTSYGSGNGTGYNQSLGVNARATLEDARGLFNDLRYDRPAPSSQFGGGSGGGGGSFGNSNGNRGFNDNLPPPKRLRPDSGRGNPQQSFNNDRFSNNSGGGNNGGFGGGGGRKFY